MPWISLYHFRTFSKQSFDSPYGLIGICRSFSRIGIDSGWPKVAAVLENTKFLTPPSTAASARLMPEARLLRKYLDGFCIDSPTRLKAAKCMTASNSPSRQTFLMSSRSAQVAEDEFRARIDRLAVARDERVENRDFVTAVEQIFGAALPM